MTAPDLRTAVRAAIRDVERRVDTCPGCDTSKAHGVHGKDCSWKALRSALTAEATEPPADPGGFVAEILADYGDDLTNADDRVEAINRIASALTPGSAPNPQGADDRCRVSENGSVSHRWACDFGPDCPAPGGVMHDPQGADEPNEHCPFCLITVGRAPAEIVRRWDDAIAIVPLDPVTDGHLLVIPRQHVADALTVPEVSALTMRRAAELADGSCNLITSVGAEATQTVRHLHLHVVPRRSGDGLALPWAAAVGAPDDPAADDLTELLAYADRQGTPGYAPCSALSRSAARRIVGEVERLRAAAPASEDDEPIDG